MARTKKKYANGQPRTSANKSASLGRNPKDYSKGIRSHHGGAADEVMAKLSEQIKRKIIYG